MDYAAFGEAFVYRAVTPERVVEAVRRIAGNVVEIGPIKAGPGGRATVFAKGRLGEPEADEAASIPLTYTVRLPVDVDIQVKVGTVNHYSATGSVDLRLAVITARPLSLVIDVSPVDPGDVHFRIDAKGVQAKLLGRAGDVDGELRRHTAEYVNHQISSPAASRLTTIDIVPLMDRVWENL
jgi:hypothetical protein